jgi:LysM repeat protein
MYNINEIVRQDNGEFFDTYTIKSGDTLYAIAKKFNVNPNLLMLLNGLELNDYIYPNQVVMIPKSNYSYYITKDGDSLSLVAKTFNTTESNLINNNKTIYLAEGQLIVNRID